MEGSYKLSILFFYLEDNPTTTLQNSNVAHEKANEWNPSISHDKKSCAN